MFDDNIHVHSPGYVNFDFTLNPVLKNVVNRDWGLYYDRINKPRTAVKHFENALLINQYDKRSHLQLSECKLELARNKSALLSAKIAEEIDPENRDAQYQTIRCLYDTNQYEKCLVKAYETKYRTRMISNNPVCDDYLDTVKHTIDNTIGCDAGPCLFKARKVIEKFTSEDAKITYDKRPMWKILKERKACDTGSDIVKPKTIIQPRIFKQRASNLNVIANMYFDSSTACNIQCIKKLITDPNFNLKQTSESTAYVQNVLKTHYDQLCVFKAMLEKRHPIYSKRFIMIRDQRKAATHKEENLYKIQYQTRRDLFYHLCKIRHIYYTGTLNELIKYAEEVLMKFFSIKVKRVLPRKFTFLSEIYNIIGLAYIREVKVPIDLMEKEQESRLFYLLDLPIDHYENVHIEKKFFDRKTYADTDAPNYAYMAYKAKVDMLEERCGLVKYPVELCYLYHEIANLHLTQHRIDEARTLSRRLIKESRKAGNLVWQFLGYLVNIRSKALKQNAYSVRSILPAMGAIADYLNEELQHYVETAWNIADESIRQTAEEELVRQRYIKFQLI